MMVNEDCDYNFCYFYYDFDFDFTFIYFISILEFDGLNFGEILLI